MGNVDARWKRNTRFKHIKKKGYTMIAFMFWRPITDRVLLAGLVEGMIELALVLLAFYDAFIAGGI